MFIILKNKKNNLLLIRYLIAGNTQTVAGLVSNCLPPWLLIQMASTPWLNAISASSGLMIPFKITFNFVLALNALINYQFISLFILWMKDSNWLSDRKDNLIFKSLKTSREVSGENLFLSSLLLLPKVCVSTVMAIAVNPFSSTNFTIC